MHQIAIYNKDAKMLTRHASNCHLGGSNEYPQSMFWSKNKKYRYTPANPSFAI